MHALAGDPRSEPCDGEAQPGAGGFARGRGDWGRWINRGSASRTREGHQRRGAIAGPRAIPKDDAGFGAVHPTLERIKEERSGGSGHELTPIKLLAWQTRVEAAQQTTAKPFVIHLSGLLA